LSISSPLLPTSSPAAHYRGTFGVLCTAVGAYALLQSLVVPVLPTIQAALHTSQNTVTWVLTAYLLSASIFTPVLGRLGDMYGKERFLVIALLALTVGSVLAALSGSIFLMIVARALQGVGGGVLPLSFGIVRDEFPPEKVTGAVGVIAALAAAGAGLGIVLAGPIVDVLDFHWLFWIPAIVLAGATVFAKIVVPESPVRTPGKLNPVAITLLTLWLVAVILGVSEAPTWGWGSSSVLGLLLGGLLLALVWIRVESRSPHPLVDMTMMRIPTVWTTNLVAFLLGIGMYAVFAFLPEFVQTPRSAGYGFGSSITHSGLLLLPATVMMFLFGMISGRLSKRWGPKAVLVAGALISIVTFVLLTTARTQQWEIVLAMAIEGVGFGLVFAAMSNLVVQAVSPAQTGVASGMNANIRTIGGAAGAAVMSSIVTSGAHGGLPRSSGYTHGFAMLAGASIVAAIAATLVPRRLKKIAETEFVLPHAELGIVAAGTLVGDDSE